MHPPDAAAPPPPTSKVRIRWLWEKAATLLAILGLSDLFSQIVKWAAAIHWLVDKYRIMKVWLFGWIPIHIPVEWHDYVLLAAVLFSVTNVGLYRSKRKVFLLLVIQMFRDPTKGFDEFRNSNRFEDQAAIMASSLIFLIFFVYAGVKIWHIFVHINEITEIGAESGHLPDLAFFTDVLQSLAPVPALLIAVPLSASISFGIFLAWRWVLVTLGLFAGLIAVNEIYLYWLEPLSRLGS